MLLALEVHCRKTVDRQSSICHSGYLKISTFHFCFEFAIQ